MVQARLPCSDHASESPPVSCQIVQVNRCPIHLRSINVRWHSSHRIKSPNSQIITADMDATAAEVSPPLHWLVLPNTCDRPSLVPSGHDGLAGHGCNALESRAMAANPPVNAIVDMVAFGVCCCVGLHRYHSLEGSPEWRRGTVSRAGSCTCLVPGVGAWGMARSTHLHELRTCGFDSCPPSTSLAADSMHPRILPAGESQSLRSRDR